MDGFLASRGDWNGGGWSPATWSNMEGQARRINDRGHTNGNRTAAMVASFGSRLNGYRPGEQAVGSQNQVQGNNNCMDTLTDEADGQAFEYESNSMPHQHDNNRTTSNYAQSSNKSTVNSAYAQSNQPKSDTRKSKRDVTRTVIITKVRSELLGSAATIVAKLKELNLDEKTIDTLSFTSASSCLIELKDQKDVEKALGLSVTTITNGGNISKLTFTNPNNFVLLYDTSMEELNQADTKYECGDLQGNWEEMGILHIENLRSNYKDRPTGIIKAYCKDENTAQKLLDHGLKFNYIKHNVSKFKKRTTVTVCYKCSGFNHMAIHCKKPEKCYKCSEAHAGYNCPLKKESQDAQRAKYKCPACAGDHPLTYGNCPKRKEMEQNKPTSLRHGEQEGYRTYSTFNRPQRSPTYAKSLEESTALQAIMGKLCGMEELMGKLCSNLNVFEERLAKCMDRIGETESTIANVNGRVNSVDAKIEHLFEFTLKQLFKFHKGLQSEKNFISCAQKHFCNQLDFLHEGEKQTRSLNQTNLGQRSIYQTSINNV